MLQRREPTRTDHMAKAFELIQKAQGELLAVDLRTAVNVRESLQRARGQAYDLLATLADALCRDTPGCSVSKGDCGEDAVGSGGGQVVDRAN